MGQATSLSHTQWECKYHVIFIPKYRRKTLFGHIRQELWSMLRQLAEHKESWIEEGHLMPYYVHMMISIPPKYAIAQVVGHIKGESAIYIARTYMERHRNYVGQHFWIRGYYASTVGRGERVIRKYICNQEKEDRRVEQMRLDIAMAHYQGHQGIACDSVQSALIGSQFNPCLPTPKSA